MIEKTIYGISNALYDAFGKEYKINPDKIEQNVKPPCFLIKPLNNIRKRLLGERFIQEQSFDIHFFPKKEKNTLECAAVLSRLYDAMEHITVDNDFVWGTNLHGEIHDGVLHFFVDYNFFLMKQEEKESMGDAEIRVMERMAWNGNKERRN